MNLLFINAGRRCELVSAFARVLNLHSTGLVYATDINPMAPALALADEAFILPQRDSEDCLRSLLRICQEKEIDLLIPTIDPDLPWLDEHRDAFAAARPGIRLLIPSKFTIDNSADKRRSRDLFVAAGLRIPQRYDIGDDELPFPLFIKPARGSASEGAMRIDSEEDLQTAWSKTELPVLEELITGEEITLDVLCDFDGKAHFALPRRRLAVRGGEVSRGVLARDAELESLALRAAEAFSATGPVTVQFRKHASGDWIPMEVNARMGGGLPLSIAAGADWPGMILKMCVGKGLPKELPVCDGVTMSRSDQSLFTKPDDAAPLQMRGIEAFIFDMDDTLYLERDFVFSGYRAVAERVYADYSVDVEGELVRRFEAGQRGDLFTPSLSKFSLSPGESYIKKLVSVYREAEPSIQPCIDTGYLYQLRELGCRLALMTDGYESVQRRKFSALGLHDLFDVEVFSDSIAGRDSWKPSPLPYTAALDGLGRAADVTLFVGDNVTKDFVTAKQMGMRTLMISRPAGLYRNVFPKDEAHAAEGKIESLTDLREILDLSHLTSK